MRGLEPDKYAMAGNSRPQDEQAPDEIYHDVPLSDDNHGLGIQLEASRARQEVSAYPPQELPAGEPSPRQASEQHPLISPASSSGFSGRTMCAPTPIVSPAKLSTKRSASSLWSYMQPPADRTSQINLIHRDSEKSVLGRYESLASNESDSSLQSIRRGRMAWISLITLALAVYSTVTSGGFMLLAALQPHYHQFIMSDGLITPRLAALLTSAIAKTTEMAFVTVIVAWIGQILSRRAADSGRRRSGFTLAELSMRNWVVQPGTMFSRWDSVRYAGWTTLGAASIVAAVLATLYYPATTALVQPQLRFLSWQSRTLQGLVRAQFANIYYVHDQCHTPASVDPDKANRTSTCSMIEHSAMAYHNYYTYLGMWNDYSVQSNASTSLSDRPPGFALYNDTVTVTAPWVQPDNPATSYRDTGIIINNVSLAFPHVGVVTAAQDPINRIMQPSDLEGIGVYNIRASVPSPVIHAMCATMAEEQLYPLIATDWLNAHLSALGPNTDFPTAYSDPYRYANGTNASTALHEIFQWGEQYGDHKWPPIFPRIPGTYNTVMNGTVNTTWGREAIYILGNALPAADSNENYFLCQLQVSLEPNCYTRYNATGTGGTLDAVCDDSAGKLQYSDSAPASLRGNATLDQEWPNVATDWGESLAFDTGPVDNGAATARLLTQLVLQQPVLSPNAPSAAEALAVMAGCTLLQSSQDAPFVNDKWNYTQGVTNESVLEQPVYQYFHASVRAQQYASGGTKTIQYVFFPVLLGVFVLSACAMAYFACHRHWYTDFSEPSNLFSLAVNSPPSDALAASCATGPKGKDYAMAWRLAEDEGRVYVKSHVPEDSDKVVRRRKGLR